MGNQILEGENVSAAEFTEHELGAALNSLVQERGTITLFLG